MRVAFRADRVAVRPLLHHVAGLAVCDGKFGLIRHYSWRTAVCSKKCLDRFKARGESDTEWLCRFRAA